MDDRTERFLKKMNYPSEWISWGMYPEELALIQRKGYRPGAEAASEHFRNGAFHWWLRAGNPSRVELEKLLKLASLDPDPLMAEDVLSHIRKAPGYDDGLEQLATELFPTSSRP